MSEQQKQEVPQIEVKDFSEASKRFTEVYFALGAFQSALGRASQAFAEQDGKWMSNFLICEAILSILESKKLITREEFEEEMTRLGQELKAHRDRLEQEAEQSAAEAAEKLADSAEAAVKAAEEKAAKEKVAKKKAK
jgi:hypothetical protein